MPEGSESTIGTLDWIALAIIAALFANFLVRRAPVKIWRNEAGFHPDRPPGWWPLGLALWRGGVRVSSTPIFSITFLAVLIFGLVVGLEIEALLYPAAITAVLVAALFWLIVLLARPKWLIAPHLRHQPGVIAEWLGTEVGRTEPPGKLLHRPGPERPEEPPGFPTPADRRWFAKLIAPLAVALAIAGVLALLHVSTSLGVGLLIAASVAVIELVRELRVSRRIERRAGPSLTEALAHRGREDAWLDLPERMIALLGGTAGDRAELARICAVLERDPNLLDRREAAIYDFVVRRLAERLAERGPAGQGDSLEELRELAPTLTAAIGDRLGSLRNGESTSP